MYHHARAVLINSFKFIHSPPYSIYTHIYIYTYIHTHRSIHQYVYTGRNSYIHTPIHTYRVKLTSSSFFVCIHFFCSNFVFTVYYYYFLFQKKNNFYLWKKEWFFYSFLSLFSMCKFYLYSREKRENVGINRVFIWKRAIDQNTFFNWFRSQKGHES